MISAGVSVNSNNSLGMTPVNMLRYLDCTSNPIDTYDEEKSGHSKLVKLLVMEGNSQDICGRILLRYVISELPQSSLLQFLVNRAADLNISFTVQVICTERIKFALQKNHVWINSIKFS
mgnify:CR=1 FL=1